MQRPRRDATAGPDLVERRARSLTAEELAAGIEDPEALAEAVLTESEERTFDRRAPGGRIPESRHSEDTVDLPASEPPAPPPPDGGRRRRRPEPDGS